MASLEHALEDGLLHRGCRAGSEQDPERSTEVHCNGQFEDSVLPFLFVQKEDGSAAGFEPKRSRFFTFFTAGVN